MDNYLFTSYEVLTVFFLLNFSTKKKTFSYLLTHVRLRLESNSQHSYKTALDKNFSDVKRNLCPSHRHVGWISAESQNWLYHRSQPPVGLTRPDNALSEGWMRYHWHVRWHLLALLSGGDADVKETEREHLKQVHLVQRRGPTTGCCVYCNEPMGCMKDTESVNRWATTCFSSKISLHVIIS